MLVVLAVFFVLSVVPRGRNSNINFLTVLIVSIIEGLSSVILFFTESQLVETLDRTADSITLYLFFASILFSILNPIVFRLRNRQSQRYRYR